MLCEYSHTMSESLSQIRTIVDEIQHFFLRDCFLLAHPVYDKLCFAYFSQSINLFCLRHTKQKGTMNDSKMKNSVSTGHKGSRKLDFNLYFFSIGLILTLYNNFR